jgi:hypothetical protein
MRLPKGYGAPLLIKMKQWYFDLPEFRAEVGFKFHFSGGPSAERQYLHLCEVTEVVPCKKLIYSWRYDGYAGNSFVTFELFEQGDKTLLRLTHAGLESFPQQNPDLVACNFAEGWTSLIGLSLGKYLGPDNERDYKNSILVTATAQAAFESLTENISGWWSTDIEGPANKIGDTFTVRFGNTFKTMLVEFIRPGTKVIWKCVDAYIDMLRLADKSEWIGTRLVWEVGSQEGGTQVTLTHIGLTPAFECFDVCEKGWDYYLYESLEKYLNTGIGQPQKKAQ